jgi:GTP-binding protein
MAEPVVAIVGRPNVGKSTFFNRCIGDRHAIVDDRPGVTRDRIYRKADWAGRNFLLIDTGGIVPDGSETINKEVLIQAKLAIEEADVIVFLVDGKAGLNGADEDVANILRRSRKPVILAVNKVDTPKEEANALEFYKLGLGEPFSLSAMRGSGGVGDVLDKIVEAFPAWSVPKTKAEQEENLEEGNTENIDPQAPISVAFVGKPNVGKSSMINVLCGTTRTIVADEPGTTRDAIDTTISSHGQEYTIIDTAGIRRKSRVEYGIEAFSVARSLRAITRSDVAVLMLDAAEEITDQDKKIAHKIVEAGKAAVIVYNKWDIIEEKSSRMMNEIIERTHADLRELSFAEVLFTSAKTKQRPSKILSAVKNAREQSIRRISTALLNQIVNESAVLVPPPASKRGKRLRIYYSTQVSVSPPTFVLFANDNKLLTKSYEIYLERKLREAFGFQGTPIRLIVRAKQEKK